jgi:DUF4097 and DUF4098 domain-containing protein YvlB
MFLSMVGKAQVFTETITKEFKFEKPDPKNTMILANINGHIKVEGYSGDKIIVEAVRTIKAKTEARLEKGKAEMQLRSIDRYDTIIFYAGGGCQQFGYQTGKGRDRWTWDWNCRDRECDQEYDYKFDFTVKVPNSVNIEVSTINDGNVTVAQMKGAVKANNINGAITLTGLEGATEAHTINGDVDLDYTKNPGTACRFYTLNGDINANFQKGLAANMSFKSFNGDLYTNLNDLTGLPTELEKVESKNGLKLKVGGSKYKIGQGGALLDFETFNGDAIIKEK